MRNWSEEEFNALTQQVIGICIEIHKGIGCGLLESSYGACLAHDLAQAAISFKGEVPVPVVYKNVRLECGYRLDFLIKDVLIIELKSVERILPIHRAQLLTYLKLTGCPIGLLVNFNVPLLKDGIVRIRN